MRVTAKIYAHNSLYVNSRRLSARITVFFFLPSFSCLAGLHVPTSTALYASIGVD